MVLFGEARECSWMWKLLVLLDVYTAVFVYVCGRVTAVSVGVPRRGMAVRIVVSVELGVVLVIYLLNLDLSIFHSML